MHGGYIKVWRKMLDSEVMQDDWLCRLWMWCMFKAQWQDSDRKGSPARGSFVTTRSRGSDELKVSGSRFYEGLVRLSDIGCITIESNNKATTITVCNYTLYQDKTSDEDEKATTKQQRSNNEATTKQQPTEYKKERMEEEKPGGAPLDSNPPGDASHDGEKGFGGAPPAILPESQGRSFSVDSRLSTDNLAFLWRSHVRLRKPEPIELVASGIDEMVAAGIPRQAIFDEVMRGPTTTPARDRSEWLKQMQDRLKKRLGIAPQAFGKEKATLSDSVRSVAEWASEGQE